MSAGHGGARAAPDVWPAPVPPARPARRRAAVAIGDVFVDHVCELRGAEELLAVERPDSGTNLFAPIAVEVGGAGAQFAIAARQAGFTPVTSIGRVGGRRGRGRLIPDQQGAHAFRFLRANRVRALWSLDAEHGTGRAIVMYLPPDRRVLVSDPLANTTFAVSNLTEEMRAAVRDAALVHVSGYTLVQPHRQQAVLDLLGEARQGGATTALDLVPHDLDRYVDVKALLARLGDLIDWLIAETGTAHRALGWGRLERPDPEVTRQLLDAMSETFPAVVLYPHPSLAVVARQGRHWEQPFAYVPGRSSRGRSAQTQAELLYRHAG